MTHLTYANWAITGLEGVVTMLEVLDRQGGTITAEMHKRLAAATEKLETVVVNMDKKVENR